MRFFKNGFPRSTGRARKGFSLAEMLIALLVVLLVSIIMATGIPSAINAYHNAVAGANAQVALSTVATSLRDELGMATQVKLSGESVVSAYKCGEGYWAKLENGTGSNRAPVKSAIDSRVDTASWTIVPNAQLTATQGDLRALFGSITYDSAKHVFKVMNLRVVDDKGNVLARIGKTDQDYLAIRASYCEVNTAT